MAYLIYFIFNINMHTSKKFVSRWATLLILPTNNKTDLTIRVQAVDWNHGPVYKRQLYL